MATDGMRIGIATDHGGFVLKNGLAEQLRSARYTICSSDVGVSVGAGRHADDRVP